MNPTLPFLTTLLLAPLAAHAIATTSLKTEFLRSQGKDTKLLSLEARPMENVL